MSAGDVSNSEFVGSLYRDHRGWLLAWLNRNLGCRQRAEDLSQDTFVRLLGRPELPGLREPRAFLAKVARGLMIDHFRRAGRRAAELPWCEEVAVGVPHTAGLRGGRRTTSPPRRAAGQRRCRPCDARLAGQ